MIKASLTPGHDITSPAAFYQRKPNLGPLIALNLSLLTPKTFVTRPLESLKQFHNLDEFLADFDETFAMFQFVLHHLKSSDVSMATTMMDFINYTCNVEPNLTISEVLLFVAIWFICDENLHRIPPCSDKGRPGRSRRERKSKYKIAEAFVKLEQRQKAAQERDRAGGIWAKPTFWGLVQAELRHFRIDNSALISLGSTGDIRWGPGLKKPWPGRAQRLPGLDLNRSDRSEMISEKADFNVGTGDLPRIEFHNSQSCRACRQLLRVLYPDLNGCGSVLCSGKAFPSDRIRLCIPEMPFLAEIPFQDQSKLGSFRAAILSYPARSCGFDVQTDLVRASRIKRDLYDAIELGWDEDGKPIGANLAMRPLGTA